MSGTIDPAVIDGASKADLHLVLLLSRLRGLADDDTASLLAVLEQTYNQAPDHFQQRLRDGHWDPVSIRMADGLSVGRFRAICVAQLARSPWWPQAVQGEHGSNLLDFTGLAG